LVSGHGEFLPHAAATQAPLQDVLSGPRVYGSHPITWTSELLKAFFEYKASLSWATLLAHPYASARLALVTDASMSSMGAMLQHINNACQPLACFSKRHNPAQQNFSTYYRQLLAIWKAVIRHILEARHFTIFNDHKPKMRDKCTQRQFNHLDFVTQFTTDTRHISGQDVADASYRVMYVTVPPSHDALAASQDVDDDL
jgi:hypothetical protein